MANGHNNIRATFILDDLVLLNEFLFLMVLNTSMMISQAVEDRTFCMANAATTCANSCTGVVIKI